MNVTFLSDTHGRHRQLTLPGGDLLLHGGDVTNGRAEQLADFLDWLAGQRYTYKVFIAGNMDRMLEAQPEHWCNDLPEGTFYLVNETVEIEGLTIWGSPYIPRFVGAFNLDTEMELAHIWQNMPNRLDILLTHTPPLGRLDRTSFGISVGCAALRRRVDEVRPRYHLFGHVHEAFGREEEEGTVFINGSAVRGPMWVRKEAAIKLEIVPG